ncbi:MAG TPA: DUF983 domain-containing protein [Phenylobacterium sp.]|uniref:DUF983 domain-containing protein n=1 Tax=Phenylobacterium sp. TaxID=1871053 RepID=UPI002BB298D4|nr:DUF983 domain-containing protein [Phenylobacterium sp.]HSV04182.1 DUF983 domain-containing protein [Phenylobacterium sp.]
MQEVAHPLGASLWRGAKGHCPACGKGRLFWKYLKVNDRCECCEEDLSRYPADDGPAYTTILLTGHLIIVPLLFIPWVWRNPVHSVPLVMGGLVVSTLSVLPRIKGAWIGLMYALAVKSTDAHLHTADAAD